MPLSHPRLKIFSFIQTSLDNSFFCTFFISMKQLNLFYDILLNFSLVCILLQKNNSLLDRGTLQNYIFSYK